MTFKEIAGGMKDKCRPDESVISELKKKVSVTEDTTADVTEKQQDIAPPIQMKKSIFFRLVPALSLCVIIAAVLIAIPKGGVTGYSGGNEMATPPYETAAGVYATAPAMGGDEMAYETAVVATEAVTATGAATTAVMPSEAPLITEKPAEEPAVQTLPPSDTIPGCVETAYVPHWSDMKYYEQFSCLTYQGRDYCATDLIPSNSDLSYLDTVTATGYDIYTDTEHTMNFDLYSIAGYDSEIILAAAAEGQDEIRCYRSSFEPKTMGEWIDKLHIRDELIILGAYYMNTTGETKTIGDATYLVYTDEIYKFDDYSFVHDMLMPESAWEAVNEPDKDPFFMNEGGRKLDLSVSIPTFGIYSKSISVFDNGYISSNLGDTQKCFFIGKTAAQKFIDYVLENGEKTILYDSNKQWEDYDPSHAIPAAAEEEYSSDIVVVFTSVAE